VHSGIGDNKAFDLLEKQRYEMPKLAFDIYDGAIRWAIRD
jgi:hypothetical protein